MTEKRERRSSLVDRLAERYPFVNKVIPQRFQGELVYQRTEQPHREVDPTVPQHLAIIIDGNRRWADSQAIPREQGHQEGADNIGRIIGAARERGIDTISIFLLSQQNLRKRGSEELTHLTRIIQDTVIKKIVPELIEEGVHVNFIGRKNGLPAEMKRKVHEIESDSNNQNNTQGTVNFALNYDGRDDIVQAVKRLRRRPWQRTTEKAIDSQLSTAGQEDVDLLIRTGGDSRISRFLIWQADQAELVFMEEMWPDFNESHLDAALKNYAKAERKMGK